MKIIITGGGTGGHIIPALAILDIIKDKYKDVSIIYLGSKDSLEEELAVKEGYTFKVVKTGYIDRKFFSIHNLKSIFKNIAGVFQSLNIIRKFSPDLIIGTGGYVSGPVVFAGKILKKKIIIHEQNAYPGITNKITGRFSDKIMIGFNEASKYFKDKSKIVFTGNPIRKEIISVDYNESRNYFGLMEGDFFVYSFGGSGGQRTINEAIMNSLQTLKNKKNIRWLHVTGKNHYENFMKKVEKEGIIIPENVEIIEYMYEAPKALMASDLVIGSAGAISIAEIVYLGKPSILIPKKYTAENHQFYNAKEIEDKGAGKVILEDELNSEILIDNVFDIMDNEKR
ncbi:MAG: undecaprenyldiphospho-muramoylpentapeptide beta-N-acetylglucosaminyltransferase, partial [Bacillota bacterium]|nr:undecaprenyldiphospho-muramoylpentapeptide beta-N-acetylglucosaminyltransferase [Bacillota bacterium]